MERDRGFNFKLFVPARVTNGQVSTVRPQEIVENCGDFIPPLQQSYSKCFGKEHSMSFPNTSVVTPTKPTRQDFPKMKVVAPMEKDENNSNPGQLYSKLFDEVEKIKCWKVKVDTETMQKERRLQENKRTIETQRKAIQELQFGNESLSIKLEEQISENEDLRNKNNATRNLCNILKDTFQRSAEKIHLFELEREETHHLFIKNSETIQKLITAFESLCVQEEADQQKMQKIKVDLLQFEDLKEKYHQECEMKEREVAMLQTKLKEKESELQKVLLDFHETQTHCKQLQEATNEQSELLRSSKTKQESLLQELQTAEQRCKEAEKNHNAVAAMLEQSKDKYAEMIQSKNLNLEELSRLKDQQAEKLKQNQGTIQELQNSLALELQRAEEFENKLMANNKELERRDTVLAQTLELSAKKNEQIKILKDELEKKTKYTESMKEKIDVTDVIVKELRAELSRKTEEAQLSRNEAEVAFAEKDSLKRARKAAEKAQEDLREKCTLMQNNVQGLEEQLFTEKSRNKEHTIQIEQLRKDITQHEVKYKALLSNLNELQSEKRAIQQQFKSGSSNLKAVEEDMKASEEKAVKLSREIHQLQAENQCLREEVNSTKSKMQVVYQETETLQKKIEKGIEHLQEEMTEKEKQIKCVETKLGNLRKKFEIKLKVLSECQKENKKLNKHIAKEAAKSSQLESVINSLQEESKSLKRQNEEDQQRLLKELESKSTLAAELENELQTLKLMAAEAIKSKEDTELKCQHKIADMVALMEKYKSQYDRMVEEKDAELDKKKKKEMEAVTSRKSLELELEKQKIDNEQLEQQLKAEVTERENLQKELTDLKKEMSSLKLTQLSGGQNQSPASNCKQRRCPETPKESFLKRHQFDFSKSKKTPSYTKDDGRAAVMETADSDSVSIKTSGGTTPKTKEIHNEVLKTPRRITNRNGVGQTSKIKSYRIRTPPPAVAGDWGKGTIEFEPNSDSSDQTDLLSFTSVLAPNFSTSAHNIIKKSPVTYKSPGNSLKLAAMKRMRDAGWTAVTGCDIKKKRSSEKIFA